MRNQEKGSIAATNLVIFAERDADRKNAEILREKLHIAIVDHMPDAKSGTLTLCLSEEGLAQIGRASCRERV